MGQALSFPSKSSSLSSSHERPALAPETASLKKCATLSHHSLSLVRPFQASSTRQLQTDRDPNSDPAQIRPMQITNSSLAQPGRIKSFQPNTIPSSPKAQTGSLHSSITSIPAGSSTSLPPLARNLPVSPALEKFRYRPAPEPTSDERSTDQASCAPQSSRKRIKIQPSSEDTDVTECKSYTGTAEPTARPPPLPPPPTLIVLPEYDEFGEIVTPDPQPSQDHTRPELLSQDCDSNGQTFETDLSSSFELPSQLARRIRLSQSSTQSRSHSIHGRGFDFGTQPSDPDEVDCYDEADLGQQETPEDLSRILEELEASGNLEADLAFSDDEKDQLEAAVPVSAAEETDDRSSQEPPLSASWGSPKPAPKAFGLEANDIAPFAEHRKRSQMHANPCSSSARKFGTERFDVASSPSRTFRALSSEAAKDKVQRPSVEPRTPLGPRTSPPAPPKNNLIPAHPRKKCNSLDYLMAKHTPVPERPTHRLVPLTPEGLTTHLTRMLDSYRGETAATKALVESHQMIIDEQNDEIVRLRGELRRLEATERRCENLTHRVEVLEQIRRGLLDMLEDKENEFRALRSELEWYRDKSASTAHARSNLSFSIIMPCSKLRRRSRSISDRAGPSVGENAC